VEYHLERFSYTSGYSLSIVKNQATPRFPGI
jgi:hypothetical protein